MEYNLKILEQLLYRAFLILYFYNSASTCVLSYVWLSVTPWTVAHQAPLSMEFPGKNTGMGSHSLLRDLPNQGIEPRSPALQADSVLSEPPGKPDNILVEQ